MLSEQALFWKLLLLSLSRDKLKYVTIYERLYDVWVGLSFFVEISPEFGGLMKSVALFHE